MIIGRRLVPLLALGLTMAAFAEGLFDFLPEPPPEANPRAAIERAEHLLASGEVAMALHHLDRASNAIGETAEILLDIARCQIQLDQLNDAHRTLVRAIDQRMAELGLGEWFGDPRGAAEDALVETARDAARDRLQDELHHRASGNGATLYANQMMTTDTAAGLRSGPSAGRSHGHDHPLRARIPRDRLLSEAWTRLALIELRRSHHLVTHGIREPGSLANAMLPASLDVARAEAQRRRAAARRFLVVATRIHPGNLTARSLRDDLAAPTTNPALPAVPSVTRPLAEIPETLAPPRPLHW